MEKRSPMTLVPRVYSIKDLFIHRNTRNNRRGPFCTQTAVQPHPPDPWWAVDLQHTCLVDTVRLLNRRFSGEVHYVITSMYMNTNLLYFDGVVTRHITEAH